MVEQRAEESMSARESPLEGSDMATISVQHRPAFPFTLLVRCLQVFGGVVTMYGVTAMLTSDGLQAPNAIVALGLGLALVASIAQHAAGGPLARRLVGVCRIALDLTRARYSAEPRGARVCGPASATVAQLLLRERWCACRVRRGDLHRSRVACERRASGTRSNLSWHANREH